MLRANNLSLGLITLALLTSGCTLKTSDSALNGHATFRVDSTSGTVVNETVIPGWDIPLERRFNLTACIKSLSEREDVSNHPFEISGDGRIYNRSTDSHGCVNWTELLSFDYLAKPTFINLNRHIKSLGKQRGDIEFSVAVNPWSGLLGQESAVVDLSRGSVTRLADSDANFSALKSNSASASAVALEIESLDYRLQLNNPSASQDAVMHIEFKPKLILQDMSGATIRQSLERGTFVVTAYLVRLDENGKRTLVHKPIQPQSVKLENGNAIFNAPIKFNDVKLDTQKAYALALIVVPSNGPSYIADYRRVYDIPSFSALQNGTLSLSSSTGSASDFNMSTYLGGIQNLSAPTAAEAGGGIFVIGRINGGNNGITDESMMQRRVRISMSADVRWATDLSPLQGRAFKIYSLQPGADGKKRVITPNAPTDATGTLYWEDVVVHSIYRKQERMRLDVVFEDVVSGHQIQKCIVTNPWDFWATFFRDCDEVNDTAVPANEVLVSTVPKMPMVKVDGLCMSRTDSAISDHDILSMIQPDLSLLTKHRYNIQLTSSVLRFDDLRTGLQTPAEAMRGGWWLMSIAVFKNSPAQNTVGGISSTGSGELQPVYTVEKAVCNPGTSPAAEVEIALKDLGLMDRNNYVAIQMKPLNQNKLRFTDSSGQPSTGAYCSGAQFAANSPLTIDTDNDLISPPYIFPMNLRNGGCPIVISHDNFEDPRLRALQAQLNRKDLHQLHLETKARVDAERSQMYQTQIQQRSTGFRSYGQSLGLNPLLILDKEDLARALPNSGLDNSSKLFEALACLDQNFWADRVHQSPCSLNPEIQSIASTLCNSAATVAGDGTRCRNPLTDMLVEEKIHVFSISDANYGGGFATSLTVSNGFSLGSFDGSDFGNSISDSQSVGAALGAGVQKGPLSAGVDTTLSKSWTAFNVNFTREYTDNQVGVNTNTTLTVENADINIKLREYRRCYVVTTRETRNQGYYLCGDIQNTPEWRQERYFTIFNPGFNGAMLNSNDERNRWLIQFRGERFYYSLMSALNHNFAPFNINGVTVNITDVLKRTYSLYANRTGWGDPFILSTVAPGLDQFARIDGSIRDVPVLGFNPYKDFGNQTFRDQNDPSLRVHDHDSNFNN